MQKPQKSSRRSLAVAVALATAVGGPVAVSSCSSVGGAKSDAQAQEWSPTSGSTADARDDATGDDAEEADPTPATPDATPAAVDAPVEAPVAVSVPVATEPPPPPPLTPPLTTTKTPSPDPSSGEKRKIVFENGMLGDVGGASGRTADKDLSFSIDGKLAERKPTPKDAPKKEPPRTESTTTAPEKPEETKEENKGGTFVHAGTNPFIDTAKDALSTFAIDVDTGSFTFARRFLKQGNLPPDAAVRVEEWVNAMHYSYATPAKDSAVPFAVHVAAAPSPISKGKHVVRVALKGKEVSRNERQPTNLVFLVDVSGSMQEPDKLPLAREALKMLVNQLREDDNVAIVTYAGETRIALPTTPAMNKTAIFKGIDSLQSGGGTNMGSGMELAYREATKGLGGGRSARVMVLSDGDANIGATSHEQMLKSIRGYVSEGVMMSTVGFGTGNYNDHLMEQLADAGNGNYSYIDSQKTAEKVFVEAVDGTLEVIAQDVKIQVEWNKDAVKSYRLLGYENRDVADKDFRNDKKDAGEIGAGHTVTALYEVDLFNAAAKDDLGTVRIRAKKPRGTKAEEIAVAMPRSMLKDSALALDDDAIAASAVALAAEILRGSPYAEGRTLSEAAELLMGAAVGKNAAERKELARELLLVEPRLARR